MKKSIIQSDFENINKALKEFQRAIIGAVVRWQDGLIELGQIMRKVKIKK